MGAAGAIRSGVVCIGLLLAAAAPAGAATLTADGGSRQLSFSASPGESNWVQVTDLSAGVRVVDARLTSVTLTEIGGADCNARRGNSYSCDGAYDSIAIDLGDGSDRVEMWSAIPATVVAGAGAKDIATGSGADHVFARNGANDKIVCGDGADVVHADATEPVDPSCETVDRGSGDGGTGDGSPNGGGSSSDPDSTPADEHGHGDHGQPPAIGVPIGIVLPERALTVATPERVIAHLGCSSSAADVCRGEIVLSVFERRTAPPRPAARAARGRHSLRQQRIGRRRYRVERGKQAALPVRVAYRGHHTLVTRRRRARTRLRVVQRDAAGKVIGVTTRTAWLPLERKWSRYRGRKRR